MISEAGESNPTVFLSYANTDRERVAPLVAALESEGFDVWWDREIPRGQNFNRVIEAALNQARCAIVIWSQASVTSEWVFNEASEARRRQILVPVLIDDVDPPLEFRHLQAAHMTGWSGDRTDTEWVGLRDAVRLLLKQSKGPAVPPVIRMPGRGLRNWWQTPAGVAAGIGALLAGASLLLMALNQAALFNGSEATESPARRASAGEPAAPASSSATAPSSAVQPSPAGAPPAAAATNSGERVNLLDPAEGGKIVIANEDTWRLVIGKGPATTAVSTNGFAVFAFRDEKPVTIDAIGVFVEYANSRNVKELIVSASDQSETGPFRSQRLHRQSATARPTLTPNP